MKFQMLHIETEIFCDHEDWCDTGAPEYFERIRKQNTSENFQIGDFESRAITHFAKKGWTHDGNGHWLCKKHSRAARRAA